MRGFYRSTALALPDPATATGTHLLHASWTLGGIRSSVVRPEGGAPGEEERERDLDGKEKAAAEVDGMGKVVRRSQGLGGA